MVFLRIFGWDCRRFHLLAVSGGIVFLSVAVLGTPYAGAAEATDPGWVHAGILADSVGSGFASSRSAVEPVDTVPDVILKLGDNLQNAVNVRTL